MLGDLAALGEVVSADQKHLPAGNALCMRVLTAYFQ